MTKKRQIAITLGDPAGIGPEIVAKSFADTAFAQVFFAQATPILYGHAGCMQRAASASGLRIREIQHPGEATDAQTVYMIHAGPRELGPVGQASVWGGTCAYEAIMRAVADIKDGCITSLCTGPIHKGALRLAQIQEIGHTEILAQAFGAKSPLTLFVTKDLRIFFYTRHLSLRQAIDALNCEDICSFIENCHHAMQTLGLCAPKLALAALNPHASDGGQFGTEEAEILEPAVHTVRQRSSIDVVGPIAADSVFAQAAAKKYDAVLSLYHDQGHIAAKTYDFERTISLTLGLPVVRSSVDHGTAFDIAWQDRAHYLSMQCALEVLLDKKAQ